MPLALRMTVRQPELNPRSLEIQKFYRQQTLHEIRTVGLWYGHWETLRFFLVAFG